MTCTYGVGRGIQSKMSITQKYRRASIIKKLSRPYKDRKNNGLEEMHSFLCNSAQFSMQCKTSRGSVESTQDRGSRKERTT